MEFNYSKFNLWFKDKEGYKQIEMDIPELSDKSFFYKFKLRVVIELENIKKDLMKLIGNTRGGSLIKPLAVKTKDQKTVNLLVKIRKDNIETKELLKNILSDEDFIICESCNYKMYKIPVNVNYKKYNNTYIIQEKIPSTQIRYIYGCSNLTCICAVDEHIFKQMQSNLALRKKLIEKGENFVPNKFGFWHDIN